MPLKENTHTLAKLQRLKPDLQIQYREILSPRDYDISLKIKATVKSAPSEVDLKIKGHTKLMAACRKSAQIPGTNYFRYEGRIIQPSDTADSLAMYDGDVINLVGGSICFAADTMVMLSDGSFLRMDLVDVGTQLSGGKVRATWKQQMPTEHAMVNLQGVSITADHPVCLGGEWVLPGDVSTTPHRPVRALHNLVLDTPASIVVCGCEPESSPLVACTLGQPTGCTNDFWGTDKVIQYMKKQHGWPRLVTGACYSE